MVKVSKELVGATAMKIILAILAKGDNYGYDMVQKVKKLSNGQFKWTEASIYPVLKKMETVGFVKSYWKMVNNERPRKYYNLQEQGKIELENGKVEWELVNSMLKKFWHEDI